MDKAKLIFIEEKRRTLSNPRWALEEEMGNLNREIQKIEARYLELGGNPEELEDWPKHRKQLIVSIFPALLTIPIFYVWCSIPELPYMLSASEYNLIMDAVGLFMVGAILLPIIMFMRHFPISTREEDGVWEAFKLANRHACTSKERITVKKQLKWYPSTRRPLPQRNKMPPWKTPRR